MKLVAVVGVKEIPIEVEKRDGRYYLTIESRTFSVDAIQPTSRSLSLLIDRQSYELGVEKNQNQYSIYFYDETVHFELYEARKFKARELTKKSGPSGPLKVVAPMPGKVVRVAVSENAHVNEGDPLLVIEAMKMQNELKAGRSGIIKKISVKEGEAVAPSQTLMVVE